MADKGELGGRVALVTGGSGGIGQAILATLRETGATVVCFDRAECDVENAEAVECIKGDVGDDASVASAVRQVVERHGRLDIVIHAAGISRDAVVWKMDPAMWDEVQRVNLRGAFLLLHHAVPVMRERGGRAVLIGSINGSRGKFGTSAYSASKAGLIGLAKTVAQETARFEILVNVVEPGFVRTAMTENLPEEKRREALNEIPLGRYAEPEDVAAMVRFLCGPGARHITGQVLRVDGGQLLGA